VFAVMRMLGVTVWYNHFRQRETVEDWSNISFVIESDVIEHNAFTVVEANVDTPVLPLDGASIHFERHTIRLSDMDWLNVCPVAPILLDCRWVVVVWRRPTDGPSYLWDIDVDDLFSLRIVDRTKVQRKCVLGVIDMGPVVHQRLLQTDIAPKALIVANRPSYTKIRNTSSAS
jgi:hypothetical protein